MTNHCNHECVCLDFRHESEIAFKNHTPCMRNHDGCKSCKNDTRLLVKGDDTDADICKKCLPAYQRVGCSCSDMYKQKLILNWMNDLDSYIKNPNSCESYATAWNFLKRKIESFQNNSLSTGQQEIVSSTDIINDLEKSLDCYKIRINMLQCWQSSMRDPERKIVCDILANGFTLVTKEEINHDNNIRAVAMLEERKRISTEITRILREHPNRIVNRFFLSELEESLHNTEVK